MLRRALLVALTLVAIGCGSGSNALYPEYTAADGHAMAEREHGGGEEVAEPVPEGRLPEGITPLAYTLWLEVVPTRDRFQGRVDIRTRLDRPRRTIWLHGQGMNVTQAEVLPEGADPIAATFTQVNEDGVASLRLEREAPAGEVVISITYDAPFDRQLKGLYRVDTGGESYAFTQFEATSARVAFPCFVEPRFKTPFELTLSVRGDDQAIANTEPASTRTVGDMQEVRFQPTEPLPTYLVAMAVGPLDVVEHAPIPANAVRDRPIPFRGVAVRGQGPRLAYALEHTGALVAYLEEYFGIAYPYGKLDIIAVPDFASGAMENAGAITFRETLLLLDAQNAPEEQRRDFAYVMAHELSHQWFGDLVTMPWWDDIWLNEAFATWMGNKTVQHVHPDYHAELGVVQSAQYAMRTDSLVSARQIRQPIESTHDIRNAFDSITYSKGGAVLGMFESWLGEETFRDGIREYLNRHRFGTATADDLLDALSQMAGRDVGTPFRTFLLQPGVPLVQVTPVCEDGHARLDLAQSRYLPVGSEGDRDHSWQIPFCVRYQVGRETHDRCELITEAQARVELEGGCPAWVMPNANASGYYRFSMPAESVHTLMDRAWTQLGVRERLSVADNLIAAFEADTVDAADVYASLGRIASDDSRVATEPMSLLRWTRTNIVPEAMVPAVERFGDRLYSARARRLGWAPRRGEDGETGLLRHDVLGFEVFTARTARLRREAADRGRRYAGFGGDGHLHPDAVAPDLVGLVLAAAVQDGDAAFFDHLLSLLRASDDAVFRSEALVALGATRDEALGQRALELALDPSLRVNEVTITLSQQLSMQETRARAWDWMREHFDQVFARVATTRAGYAPWYVSSFCSAERAEEVQTFFAPRIEALPGGPRNLRGALEAIHLCAARVDAQRESAEAFFSRQR